MLNCKQEEGNALTAVGDEIRSRSAAAKKEAAKTEQVDKKVPFSRMLLLVLVDRHNLVSGFE